MKHRVVLRFVFAVVGFGFFVACGSERPPEQLAEVDLSISWTGTSPLPSDRFFLYARVEEHVLGGEIRRLGESQPVPFTSGGRVELPQIDYGNGRVLVLEVRCSTSPRSKVLYRGQSGLFDFTPESIPKIEVDMKPFFTSNEAVDPPKAFPSAEGFGAYTQGGRGGKVIAVTHLGDDGVGSLRAAIRSTGPRTVVFRVSGVIVLKTRLVISDPFVTIAGQSAPGEGILLTKNGIQIAANQVIIRHLRIRPDVEAVSNAISLRGGTNNVVLDHLSIAWSPGQSISIQRDSTNVSIQNSLLAEKLPIGDSSHIQSSDIRTDRISVHRNVLAHVGSLSTQFAGGSVTFLSNVQYNYGNRALELRAHAAPLLADVAGNLFIPGPDTKDSIAIALQGGTFGQESAIYLAGNLTKAPEASPSETEVVMEGVGLPMVQMQQSLVSATTTATPAENLFSALMNNVGASSWVRDKVDARIIQETVAGEGNTILARSEPEPLPTYVSMPPALDIDSDGMPDIWEERSGFDPEDPSDGAQDADGDGYTNLEEFLNGTPAANNQCP